MSKLTIEIGARIQGLVNGLAAARNAVSRFVGGIRATLQGIAGQLGVMLSAGAAIGFGKSIARAADEIADKSARLQVSADFYQKLAFAAKEAGSDIGEVATAFRQFTKLIDSAGQGSKSAQTSLARLGLTFEQLKGLSAEERFLALTEALGEVTDLNDRAALSVKVFGKTAGQALLPLVGSYEAVAAAAEANGLMSTEAAEAGDAAVHAYERLTAALQAAVANTGFLSYLRDIAEELENVISLENRMEAANLQPETKMRGGALGLWDDLKTRLGFGPEGEVLRTDRITGGEVRAANQRRKEEQAAKEERARVRAGEASRKAEEAAAKEKAKAAEAAAKADATVAGKIADMQAQVRWQQMVNDGKEREVEIEKALAAARKDAKRDLTGAEAAAIGKAAGELYDASNKPEAAKVRDALLGEQVSLTDQVRRIGGSLGGSGSAANKTTALLEAMRDRLRSLDEKTGWNAGKRGAVWP